MDGAGAHGAHANTELQKFRGGLSLPWEQKHICSFLCIRVCAQWLSFRDTLWKPSINCMSPGWGPRGHSPLCQGTGEVVAASTRGSNFRTTESPGYKYPVSEHWPGPGAEDKETEKWVANIYYGPVSSPLRWGERTAAICRGYSCCISETVMTMKRFQKAYCGRSEAFA